MHSAEIKLIEIGKRCAAISIQLANAYEAEQTKLKLGIVLSRERLSTSPGTLESLEAIDCLENLTKAHKEFSEKLMLASSAEISTALREFPIEARTEHVTKTAQLMNWHLVSQSEFYSARRQWIEAARKICNLVETCRDTAVFGEGITFASDEELEEFVALMARIENSHQRETTLLNERVTRISQSLGVLGGHPVT